MQARLPICLAWLAGILAAVVLICFTSMDFPAASTAQEVSALSAEPVLTAESIHAESTGHHDGGHHGEDSAGAKMSCCASAACSGPGMAANPASLFLSPAAIPYHAAPLDRLIPFDHLPSEEPPRAA